MERGIRIIANETRIRLIVVAFSISFYFILLHFISLPLVVITLM